MGIKIHYGKEEVARVVDGNGSIETVSTNYINGAPAQPIRRLYEMRHRVNPDEVLIRATDFLLDAIKPGSRKLDFSIRVEQTPINRKTNTYDIVECYTILEY